MVLIEPETSLFLDLLAPLARLIVRASTRSQIIVVTHAPPLVGAIANAGYPWMLNQQPGEPVIDVADPAPRLERHLARTASATSSAN